MITKILPVFGIGIMSLRTGVSSTGSSRRPSLYQYFFTAVGVDATVSAKWCCRTCSRKKLGEIVVMAVPALEQQAISCLLCM